MSDELDEIAPRRRLAAGKMHVQNAERRGLGEDPLPGRGVELVASAHRAPADSSNRGSPSGQRCVSSARSPTAARAEAAGAFIDRPPLGRELVRAWRDVRLDPRALGRECASPVVDDRRRGRARRRIASSTATAIASSSNTRSGASSSHSSAHIIVFQAHAARQARP